MVHFITLHQTLLPYLYTLLPPYYRIPNFIHQTLLGTNVGGVAGPQGDNGKYSSTLYQRDLII